VTGVIFKGRYDTGIVLTSPTTQDPATIATTGYVTNATSTNDGDALDGAAVAAWSLINFGTIKATGSLAHGVDLAAGGTIANHGLIENDSLPNPLKYQNAAIAIHGGAGTVINSGTIQNIGSYDAIRLNSGGKITNAAGGLISGALNGIEIFGAAGIVTNSGTIEGHGSRGVYFDAGGTVTNRGLIETSATDHSGVAFVEKTGVVVNSGTIESAGSDGIYLGQGGSVSNQRGGQITGGYDAVSVFGATGIVTNLGTITGVSISTPAGRSPTMA
jgi:hypothetical protein